MAPFEGVAKVFAEAELGHPDEADWYVDGERLWCHHFEISRSACGWFWVFYFEDIVPTKVKMANQSPHQRVSD